MSFCEEKDRLFRKFYLEMKEGEFTVEYIDAETMKKATGIDYDKLNERLKNEGLKIEDFIEYAKFIGEAVKFLSDAVRGD